MNNRPYLIIGAFVAVVALAVWGQVRADPGSFPNELLVQLYRAAELFGIQGDWTFDFDPLPWQIEAARILAPIVAFGSLILVLARDAWVTLSNQRIRFFDHHIISIGLGDLGWHFARACARNGLRLVVIESNNDNPRIERVRRLNVPVVVGEPLSTTTLKRAGITRAKDLVTFLGDATNVELIVLVRTLLEQRGRDASGPDPPLRIHCHMVDPQLAHGLEGYPKLFAGRELVETQFFNANELAARLLAFDQPSDVYADAMGRDRVHIVVIGSGRMAREVILQTANTAHFATPHRPRVTWCATGVQTLVERLRTVYPGLPQAVDLATLEAPLALHGLAEFASNPAIAGVSQFVICGTDDADSLAQAMVLRRAILLQRDVNAPILLHMQTSDGLTRMLESVEPDPEIPDGLCAFGTLDEVLNETTIINARQDVLARALHESFVEQAKANNEYDPDAGSHQPWRQLAENYRRDSRYEADHLASRLRAVDCIQTDDDATIEFTPAEVERLARIEMSRFVASRVVEGWRHGAVRSEFGKTRELRPWDERSDHSYDLTNAAAVPDLLRRAAGKGIRRICVIGITGHRTRHVALDHPTLVSAIEAVLDAIVAAHPGAAFVVLSPLAEGADRLVPEIALRRIAGAALHVPLPMPYDILTRDFGTNPGLSRAKSIREFQRLLGRAERYYEMPLKFGTLADLEQTSDDGMRARADQYALCGAFVVQRSHELIAIWDGNDTQRVGGTAQVVSWRCSGVPEPYRFPNAFFPEVPQLAPFIVSPTVGPGFIPERATTAA